MLRTLVRATIATPPWPPESPDLPWSQRASCAALDASVESVLEIRFCFIMDHTQTSSDEEFSPGYSSFQQKRSEAESSCVSLRSNRSMSYPIHFKTRDTKTDLSSVHQKRSEAESSCVSLRSNRSMSHPIHFKTRDTKTDLSSVHQKRSEAESSCVSLRSNRSMSHPIHFKTRDTKTDLSSFQQKRSEAESSCVSLRSNRSMSYPIHFKTRDTKTDLSHEVLDSTEKPQEKVLWKPWIFCSCEEDTDTDDTQ
ncbi:hypothetical protein G5714_009710 [Onychostoma macrolepis]|uniref:Uncharacterized protein n=1 Tax=Onychostoma macrolepis TaxID=369639 RepID=A0A7J6CMT9_9TELE|nr:hypothetical protein G5714_009710 [Onychostoma macrolepis]